MCVFAVMGFVACRVCFFKLLKEDKAVSNTVLGYNDRRVVVLLPYVVHTSVHARRDDVKPIGVRLHTG